MSPAPAAYWTEDPSAEDEAAPLVIQQFTEYKMPDPSADTRTTVYVKDTRALALSIGLPVETDPSKVVRIAREKLVERGLAKPLTVEEWMAMGKHFYVNERA